MLVERWYQRRSHIFLTRSSNEKTFGSNAVQTTGFVPRKTSCRNDSVISKGDIGHDEWGGVSLFWFPNLRRSRAWLNTLLHTWVVHSCSSMQFRCKKNIAAGWSLSRTRQQHTWQAHKKGVDCAGKWKPLNVTSPSHLKLSMYVQ